MKKLDEEKQKFEEEKNNARKPITEEMVYEVVSNMTKIPITKLTSDDKGLVNLEENLNNKVIGQELAVEKISKAIRRNKLVLKTQTDQSDISYF